MTCAFDENMAWTLWREKTTWNWWKTWFDLSEKALLACYKKYYFAFRDKNMTFPLWKYDLNIRNNMIWTLPKHNLDFRKTQLVCYQNMTETLWKHELHITKITTWTLEKHDLALRWNKNCVNQYRLLHLKDYSFLTAIILIEV